MRQSHLFTKTRKEAPADEVSKNAQLLIRAGFVHKEMAGVYSYLPLGVRVLSKIEGIIRREMNAIGAQENRFATLHPSEPWKQTGAWDGVDVLFKIMSRTEKEYALGQSEEEIATPIAKEYALSYKDLPLAIYQIGQKYRDELRAKSGIMRGREFGMKDLYSFHATQEDFDRYYRVVQEAYFRAFSECGLIAKATEASGGSFSEKLSYEFMVLTDAGEDDIVYCDTCSHCANVEVSSEAEGDLCTKCGQSTLKKARASEVGNVFDLGQKYPKAFDFTFTDAHGEAQYPIVGCFGFGTTRTMGVIVEKHADAAGIVWPESVAPFAVHLVDLSGSDSDKKEFVEALYSDLLRAGTDVLYDDRDLRAGEKFADSDLIGIPFRIVIGKQSTPGSIEVVRRKDGTVTKVSRDAILKGAWHF